MNETATAVNEGLVLRQDQGGVTTLTLNRPQQYNAVTQAMMNRLYVALQDIADDKSVRVVVIAGRGKAFCAGQDLIEMHENPNKAFHTVMYKNFSELMLELGRLPQPVIARVHGITSAAGCQLVAHCDLVVASSDALFGLGEIKLGLFGSTPAVPMTRMMHLRQVAEMLFTGDYVDAETARERGLVNRVVAPDALDDAVRALADSIMAKSAAAIAAGKRALYRQLGMSLSDAYAYSARTMASGMTSHDAVEGIEAFLQKREPKWQHR